MSAGKAVGLSLYATGNAAFARLAKPVQGYIKSGDNLTGALTRTHFFPEDFLHIVGVAEQGGRVPEAMVQQAEQYTEEAERRLAVLARLLGFGVWIAVASFIVFAIFRMAGMYLQTLQQFGA
jgi:type II secretory pathway component PulF